MYVWLNGKLVQSAKAKVSVFDHGFLYGDGVYETLRTYNGKVWQFREHFFRLKKSARCMKIDVRWSEAELLKQLNLLLKKNAFPESRIRITLTRGVNGFQFLGSREPTLLMVTEKLLLQPVAVYTKGVDVVTVQWQRFLPEVKSTSVLTMVYAQQFLAKKKAYEALFLDSDENILEGTMTNIHAVFGNELVVPGEDVLAGETQKTLLRLAKKYGFTVRVGKLPLKKLLQADEVFLTSSVREIMPVRKVNGKKIGNGKVGPVSQKLLQVYREFVGGGRSQ